MLQYVDQSRNKNYNLYKYNCTTFAIKSVKAAGQNAPSGSGYGVICSPNALYKELYQESKKDGHVNVSPLDKKRHDITQRMTDESHE